jgi:hypothetical protein
MIQENLMDQRKRTRLVIRLLVIGGAALLIWILVRGTLRQKQFEYMVCMDFQGGSHCATARGLTEEEAIHSAHEIDCNQLASNRDTNMVCLDKQPSTVQRVGGGKASQ